MLSLMDSPLFPSATEPGALIDVDLIAKMVNDGKYDQKDWARLVPYDLNVIVPDIVLANYEGPRVSYNALGITAELGKGGYATVYKGFFENKDVAIKVLTLKSDMLLDLHKARSELNKGTLLSSALSSFFLIWRYLSQSSLSKVN